MLEVLQWLFLGWLLWNVTTLEGRVERLEGK